MNVEMTDWDKDLPTEGEEKYQALFRTLKLTEGFGLIFVRCSPDEGENLITKVQENILNKNIKALRLEQSVDNFYNIVENLDKKENIDILFIKGLEHSFYEYEEVKRLTGWDSRDIYSYSWKSVPPVLTNLNQQRERFRDNFNICFVFLLPLFAIKYFIQRAPDFFDWRSGLFEFPTNQETLDQESSRILLEGDHDKYISLTPEERTKEILEIQELIAEDNQTPSRKGDLLFTLGNLHFAAHNYEEAIAAYDEAVKIQPDYYQAWYNRGLVLQNLERFSEAIASFEQAVKIKSDFHLAWNNQGAVLCDHLQRYEDAIASYDQAVKIKPELHEAWYNQSIALSKLGRFNEAVASLEKALKIKPDDHKAWLARAIALYSLDLYEQAMASYDKFIELKPDYAEALHLPANALDELSDNEEAIASYTKAIENLLKKYSFSYKLESYKLESLFFGVVRYEKDNLSYKLESYKPESLFFGEVRYEKHDLIPPSSVARELTQYWLKRLAVECPEQSEANRESIILWLLGSDSKRFEAINPKELDIAKQAMEYRYGILIQRYLGSGRERGYRNLIARLGSIVTLRNKIQTWIFLPGDRQRSVLDVLQEVLQELLQSDIYIQQQMADIGEFTGNTRLQTALLFASVEEYCLRPVRNQPLLVYRFVNYLRRTQRGGLTEVPSSDQVILVSEEILTDGGDNRANLLDSLAIAEYREAQKQDEQQALRLEVKQEFENYLLENLGPEAVEWLRLYLQDKSQDEIAEKLNKPLKEVYRLREKISYHAVRVFALKGKPELVESWLSISLKEHNLGLTQKQLGLLLEELTPLQRQILELRNAGNGIDAIAQQLKLKTHQVLGEWTKVYLVAQSLRTQE